MTHQTMAASPGLLARLRAEQERYRRNGLDRRAEEIRRLLEQAARHGQVDVPQPLAERLRAEVLTSLADVAAHTGSDSVPYGLPEDPDDPRFTAVSSLGWGTAAFAQHHEEFLGSNTDDDHDWRGASRYID